MGIPLFYRIGLLLSSDDNDSDADAIDDNVGKKKLSDPEDDDDGIPSFDEGEAEAEMEEKERSPTRKTSKLLKKKRLSNDEVKKVLDSDGDAETPVKKRWVLLLPNKRSATFFIYCRGVAMNFDPWVPNICAPIFSVSSKGILQLFQRDI